MLDGNQYDFIRQQAKDEISDPKLGEVVEVYEHLSEDDNSNFECDVIMDGGLFEERAVSYNGSHSNQISPPRVGDVVLVLYRAGENNKPILMDVGYSREDRAPLGRSGMYRDVYESGESPAGDGDLKITGYTEYSDNPALKDKSKLEPEKAWVQISKELPTPDPSSPDDAPMTFEMYDSPADDEAHVTASFNVVDGQETDGTWGFKFNLKTGEFKIVDANGYGITSDGNGNFTWNYETINYNQGGTDFL
jgi:hypothetical protein